MFSIFDYLRQRTCDSMLAGAYERAGNSGERKSGDRHGTGRDRGRPKIGDTKFASAAGARAIEGPEPAENRGAPEAVASFGPPKSATAAPATFAKNTAAAKSGRKIAAGSV